MSNAITEGRDRELPPDRDGEIRRAPTPAAIELQTEVLEAWRHKDAGEGEAMRSRSSIETRTDLRLAATNEAATADPARPAALAVEQETARRWADLDASDFGRIRSDVRRETALEAMAGHMRVSPEYADELGKRSPAIAGAAWTLNEERAEAERDAATRAAAELRQSGIAASNQTRAALIDAAALAAVAAVRTRETSRVVEQLAGSPEATTQQLRDAQQALKAPPLDGRVTAPDDPDIAAQQARAIKRPVAELDLTQSLLTRYVVSHEKRGLLDKGTTEFSFRSGEQQGRLAFVDAGKALNTALEDKSTIRAMVEVASAKNWKEITVSGSDDFRRNAWLEASLNGMKVRGYEPREADKQILAELQERTPNNTITVVEREHKREELPVAKKEKTARIGSPKHIDGDALTVQEKTVLDNSRAILNSKAMGEQFTEATLRELEAKLRGERVYIGEIVDHGKAPYKFDKDKDESYYVTLKTPSGEQVIWGKGLAEAMQERHVGEQVVLQNIGKRDVTVQERIRDAQGQVVGVRPKDSQLNAWKSDLLTRFSEKARTDFSNRAAARQPTLGVYDAKAPRAPVRPVEPTQTQEQKRSAEQQLKGRER